MAESTPQMQWSQVDGVAVVEVLSHDLTGPAAARAMGEQLLALLQAGHPRLLLNLTHVRVMSSTGFGTLLQFWKQAQAVGGSLRLCGLSPSVRLGADILSLGHYIPLHDTEADALAAYNNPTDAVR